MPGKIIIVIIKLSYQGNFAVFCNAYFLDGLVDQDWVRSGVASENE